MNGDLALPLTEAAAFMAGLLGGAHCLGMCGGISATLSLPATTAPVSNWRIRTLYPVLYNVGRIASYTVAGTIVGALGQGLVESIDLPRWAMVARVLTGLIIVAVGLQIGIGWRGLRPLEAAGARFWRLLAPAGRKLLPIRSTPGALGVGMLWGWLPCGLVYTMLLAAALSGSTTRGAVIMASFGVGTLPTMVAISIGGAQLGRWTQKRRARFLAGGLLLLFGLWTAAAPLYHRFGADADHRHHAGLSPQRIKGSQGLNDCWRS